ncbi:MAG: efflux RND transporter periplasmic adaptor subunit [Deltaproteobacteria bacterium]|nr:efflux RND transporter periplasmic adaptor subunit [Deltaproteobacteria bacterium]
MTHDDLSKLRIDKSEQSFHGTRSRTWLRWALPAILIALGALLYSAGILTPAIPVELTTVSRVYPSQTFTLLNASGYVVAQRKAAVASKITGRLVSLSVEEGSIVKKGDMIAHLEGDDAAALKDQAAANLNMSYFSLEQSRVELNEAALFFNRNRELLAQGLVTNAQFDAADARYKKAAAAVKSAEAGIKAGQAALRAATVSLEYSIIRAPFDAVVLTKNADVGDIVTPLGAAANAKASVVTIADMGSLQVEVDVSESNLQNVTRGQSCEIQLDALPDARFRGTVHMIVPTADRTKATVLIKVAFLDKDKRILPEMSAKVAFLSRPVQPAEQSPRIAVNRAAIVTRNNRQVVLLMNGNRAAEKPVKTGKQLGDMIEILDGIKAGDRIIAKPTDNLKNGAKIKVAEK